MIKVKCIEKKRDKNGKITHYRLSDSNNTINVLESNKVKEMIRNRSIDVVNLKLTSNGRLIEITATNNTNSSMTSMTKDVIERFTTKFELPNSGFSDDFGVVMLTKDEFQTYEDNLIEYLLVGHKTSGYVLIKARDLLGVLGLNEDSLKQTFRDGVGQESRFGKSLYDSSKYIARECYKSKKDKYQIIKPPKEMIDNLVVLCEKKGNNFSQAISNKYYGF